MAISAVQTYLSPEEYITLERKAIPDADTVRSEYVNGKIVAMAGASFSHNLITNNLSGELRALLKGTGCAVFANDMRISIQLTNSYFYPDVGVVCDEPRFEDDVFDTLLNPIVIVEVLSPSTEAYDRGEKLWHYQQLESLKEYILVSQDRVYVERYLRKQDEWGYTSFRELDDVLPIASIQCELPLHEIYERVKFPESKDN
ncbi:MAG: Uma2 family endonuclease [Candidatus Poribacteria bacterium]|nr:Uma2 family endonuclease [Candidatus Poribacteria bacterium]